MDDFWSSTKKRLNVIPFAAEVTPVSEAIPYRKYKVQLKSLDGVMIIAFLSLPIQGEEQHSKPWPVIISTPGYGGSQQGVMLSECQRGFAIIQVFPRGQGESSQLFKLDKDKLTGKLDKPEGAYYQGAYADVIRVIDFVMTRNDLDGNRIALMGTSQGGGFSIAVAALDNRVKAVVAHVPFLCNFRLASKTKSLVSNLLEKAGPVNESSFITLDYFDPLNLASKLHIPVLLSAGGKDDVCPMPTIYSVYKQLAGNKTLVFYPELKHTTSFDFYNKSWAWLDKNFTNKVK
jgi:cephalosporin-C deacetylase